MKREETWLKSLQYWYRTQLMALLVTLWSLQLLETPAMTWWPLHRARMTVIPHPLISSLTWGFASHSVLFSFSICRLNYFFKWLAAACCTAGPCGRSLVTKTIDSKLNCVGSNPSSTTQYLGQVHLSVPQFPQFLNGDNSPSLWLSKERNLHLKFLEQCLVHSRYIWKTK